MPITPHDALLIIDVQHDFLPGGALAVPEGDAIVPLIARMAEPFDTIVATQDWHPHDHISFAQHHGRAVHDVIAVPYGEQMLWPSHCVENSRGAALHPAIEAIGPDMILRKGTRKHIDSYSAFLEADRTTPTGLAGFLRERGIERVFCAGLATDFCVAWSALDAAKSGFETHVILAACRGIDAGGSLSRAIGAMREAGVKLQDEIENAAF